MRLKLVRNTSLCELSGAVVAGVRLAVQSSFTLHLPHFNCHLPTEPWVSQCSIVPSVFFLYLLRKGTFAFAGLMPFRPPNQHFPLPSNGHHWSNDECLEGKRENDHIYSVQYCVQQLCTVQSVSYTHLTLPTILRV